MSDMFSHNGQNTAMVLYGSAKTATPAFSTDNRMIPWGTGMHTTAVVPAQPLHHVGSGNEMMHVQMTPADYMGYQYWKQQCEAERMRRANMSVSISSLILRSSEQPETSM